jgi:TRAP-type mannitol/chloroaromatic compound transport system permease large subunit
MAEVMVMLLVLGVLLVLLSGFPVAFAYAGTALLFTFIGNHFFPGLYDNAFMATRHNSLYRLMVNPTLIAVPLFVFMGVMLERSKVAEELLDTMGMLFGPVRGAGYLGHHCGHAVGGQYRHRRLHRSHHGPAIAAHHAQAQLRPRPVQRRDLRPRDLGPDHSAFDRPDPARGPVIDRGVVPFTMLQVLMLFILAMWPELATWLPHHFSR